MRVDKRKFVTASGVSQVVFQSVLDKMQSCIPASSKKEGKEGCMVCTTLIHAFDVHGTSDVWCLIWSHGVLYRDTALWTWSVTKGDVVPIGVQVMRHEMKDECVCFCRRGREGKWRHRAW